MLHNIHDLHIPPTGIEVVDRRNTLLGVFSRSIVNDQHLFTRTLILFIKDSEGRGLFSLNTRGILEVPVMTETHFGQSQEATLCSFLHAYTAEDTPCTTLLSLAATEEERTFSSVFGCLLPKNTLERMQQAASHILLDPVELRGILKREPEKNTLLQRLMQEKPVADFYPLPKQPALN